MCWRSSGFDVMYGAHRLYGSGGSLARKASGAFPFQVRRHDCESDAAGAGGIIGLVNLSSGKCAMPAPGERAG